MTLRIFTGAWGKYVDTLENGCAASLGWPLNRAAIKGATWSIFTEESNFERVDEIRVRTGVTHGKNIKLIGGVNPTAAFSNALYDEMQKCVDQKATFLFALPDYIFGDGTVQNLLNLSSTEPNLCLAVPNTRVLPSIMEYFKDPWRNDELVSLAFTPSLMHQTWRESEIGNAKINTFYGGVSWKKVSEDLICVTHRLPSSYMCQFLQSDIEYFRKQLTFAAWDHEWPTKLLAEGRQRFIGSSDVAFITEITEHDKNCSPNIAVSPEGPSVFHRSMPHHKQNHSFVTVFRKGKINAGN